MRILLTGKCICSGPFHKDYKANDISLNEQSQATLQCNLCKAHLIINLVWQQAVENKTIAQKLDGKEVDNGNKIIVGETAFDPTTLIHTFNDGSKAKIITRFEIVAPFMTKSLSTSDKKHVKYWKALDF